MSGLWWRCGGGLTQNRVEGRRRADRSAGRHPWVGGHSRSCRLSEFPSVARRHEERLGEPDHRCEVAPRIVRLVFDYWPPSSSLPTHSSNGIHNESFAALQPAIDLCLHTSAL